jgi:hypothetical protein
MKFDHPNLPSFNLALETPLPASVPELPTETSNARLELLYLAAQDCFLGDQAGAAAMRKSHSDSNS